MAALAHPSRLFILNSRLLLRPQKHWRQQNDSGQMVRIPVSRKKYIELLNEELRRTPGYVTGMKFIAVEGGYSWNGRGTAKDEIYIAAAQIVSDKYDPVS